MFISNYTLLTIYSPPLTAECAGCGTTLYCSKDCQKRHWKLIHKVECARASRKGRTAAVVTKMKWRMKQFGDIYAPFLHNLVLDVYRICNKELDSGDVLFPADCLVDIQLADLPGSAKRPRLYIKRVYVRKLSEREEQLDEQLAYVGTIKAPEQGWACVRYCLSYDFGREDVFRRDDVMSTHFQFNSRIGPEELGRLKRRKKEVYKEKVDGHQNIINSIARGESPKIYRVIKECLQDKNMEQSNFGGPSDS